MRFIYLIIALTVFLVLQAFSVVSMGNAYWRVSLTAEDDGEHSPGSLIQLVDMTYGSKNWCTGRYFMTPRLFNCTLQDCSASSTANNIHFTSNSILDDHGQNVPLKTEVQYHLEGQVIHVNFKFTAEGTVDEAHSLEAYSEFEYSKIDGYTNGIHDFSYDADHAQDMVGSDAALNQFYIVHSNISDLVLLYPIPYYSQALATKLPGYQNRLQLPFLVSDGPFYYLPGEAYHSILAPGTVIEREFFILAAPPQSELGDIQHPLVYFSPHPKKADRSVIFMWDELPVPHPNDVGWLYSYDEHGANVYLNGLIALINRHPKSRMVLLTVPDGIWWGMQNSLVNGNDYYDWAGWHGTNRMKTYAPPDYIAWLKDIASHNPAYPWMTRVDLGSHGYHHTQSLTELIQHEFELTGYARAEALFHAMHDDLDAIGLSASHILTGIRFPGFQYVQDALRAGAVWGMQFYDNYKEFRHFRFTHEIFPQGEIWGVNTCWWADYDPINPPDWGRPFDWFRYILDKGKIALLGGHPEANFVPDEPASYQRMENALNIIDSYPNLEWIWPSELVDMIKRIGSLRNLTFDHASDGYRFYYDGGLAGNDTLIIDNIPSTIVPFITIDGIHLSNFELRSGRLYIENCPITTGQHTVYIPYYKIPPYIREITVKAYPNPSSGRVTFSIKGSRITDPKVRVYSMEGALIDDGSNWNWIVPDYATWSALREYNHLASGIYFYVATYNTPAGPSKATGKFAILR